MSREWTYSLIALLINCAGSVPSFYLSGGCHVPARVSAVALFGFAYAAIVHCDQYGITMELGR